ncbi:hypothetical protein, partial [Nocardia sp. NPDC051463]|uniref:hypothetical protein n=1 Tax=Nocardia sp. NPDC051463 TaxID=3154845 RepID=UPI00344B9EE6
TYEMLRAAFGAGARGPLGAVHLPAAAEGVVRPVVAAPGASPRASDGPPRDAPDCDHGWIALRSAEPGPVCLDCDAPVGGELR